jgi:hypothetical protein
MNSHRQADRQSSREELYEEMSYAVTSWLSPLQAATPTATGRSVLHPSDRWVRLFHIVIGVDNTLTYIEHTYGMAACRARILTSKGRTITAWWKIGNMKDAPPRPCHFFPPVIYPRTYRYIQIDPTLSVIGFFWFHYAVIPLSQSYLYIIHPSSPLRISHINVCLPKKRVAGSKLAQLRPHRKKEELMRLFGAGVRALRFVSPFSPQYSGETGGLAHS